MGIVGELFSEKVSTQIKQRESYFADKGTQDPLGPADPKKIQTQNAGSWLRLISSVDLAVPSDQNIPGKRKKEIEDRVSELANHLQVNPGSDLAKKVILYGGTQRYVDSPTGGAGSLNTKSGFNREGEFFGTAAYGFGGNEFGYKPMAGIQSAKIGYYNNGALAKADISITCYNPQQLEFLELLYLRPGYSILLEYGHTQYVNNQGQTETFNVLAGQSYPMDLFLRNTTTEEQLLDAIETERDNRSQNYDAFYGIVTNFNWSFNTDGSFNVTVKAISKGSVIESLKINTGGTKAEDTVTTDVETIPAENTAQTSEVSSLTALNTRLQLAIGGFGFGLPSPSETPEYTVPLGKIVSRAEKSILFSKLYELTRLYQDSVNVSGANPNAKSLIAPLGYQILRDTIGQIKPTGPGTSNFLEGGRFAWKIRYYNHAGEDDRQELGDAQYYLTFAGFLQVLQEFCLLYNERGEPVVTFEFADVPMLTFPGMFSADPTVCIIPPYYTVTDILLKEEEGLLVPELFFGEGPKQFLESIQTAPKFLLDENSFTGNLMSVFLNFSEIVKVIEQKEDKTGSVNLIEFLQTILNDVSRVLGNVNEFEVKFDQVKQRISIYDKASHIRTKYDDDKNKITVFKPYGVTTSKSTILKDIAFSSELTPEFASMISIGAQANGNQVGENATAFSEFNLGLVDRINKEKVVTKSPQGTEPKQTDEERFKTILENIKTLYAELYWINWKYPNSLNFQNLYDLKLSKRTIDILTSLNILYAKYILGYFTTVTKNIASPFFIPFNLQLTLGGIAGIKLFQKYGLEEGVIPYSYKGKINFLIKNLSHTIDKNKWETTLESLTVPVATDLQPLDIKITQQSITGSEADLDYLKNQYIYEKYGQPGDLANIVTIPIPYPMYFSNIRQTSLSVHKDVADSLLNALEKIQRVYGDRKIRELKLDQLGGTFLVKKNTNDPSRLSLHSWGIAIDIYPSANLNHQSSTTTPPAAFTKPVYKDFIDIMEENGWYSLGRFANKDYMHFQTWDLKKRTGPYKTVTQ
jgi:hypothetical protein